MAVAKAGTGERSSLQRQARALGDPTRYRIFRYVAEAETPARIAEMASYFGLHHNAVRQHVAKLVDAGLLTEAQAARSGSGRPPLEYRLAPETAGQWDTPAPSEQVAMLLLDLHRSGQSPRDVGAAAGRRVGEAVASDSPIDHLEAEMARLGFRPRRKEVGSTVELVFDRCPVATLAAKDPDVVCDLHSGFADGILDAGDSDYRVADLIRNDDPRQGGCRLVLKPATSGQEPSRPEASR